MLIRCPTFLIIKVTSYLKQTVNKLKKTIKYFGIFIFLIMLLRGFLYRISINYLEVCTRNNITLTDKKLINEIDNRTSDKILRIEEIIELSNKITSEKLDFTFNKVSSNPNLAYELEKANCIGYSSLFNSIVNGGSNS